jgi:phosphoserine phosphatase
MLKLTARRSQVSSLEGGQEVCIHLPDSELVSPLPGGSLNGVNKLIRLAISDVDGTLTPKGYCYIERQAEALYEEGLFSSVHLRSMSSIHTKFVGRQDGYSYTQCAIDMVNEYAAGIAGVRQEDAFQVAKNYIRRHPEDFHPFAEELISIVKGRNFKTILISGSPLEIILPLSQHLSLDIGIGTLCEVEGGVFTGRVERNCGLARAKRRLIQQYAQSGNVDLQNSVGFGDSYHDIGFLALVGYGVAIHPDERLKRVARHKRWLICEKGDNVAELVKAFLSGEPKICDSQAHSSIHASPARSSSVGLLDYAYGF